MTTILSRPEIETLVNVAAYAPQQPPYHPPLQVAEDTYLIRSTFNEGHGPFFAYVNSMLITGKEPVIVDTGTVANREQWLNDVFSFVDPKDVRWIFLSHDDHDHVGNVLEALELCPNATLITTWFQTERLAGDVSFPLNRLRWLDDGGSLDIGDRVITAIRPPMFDSPTTRGLYDSKSGVYWAADGFGVPCTGPIDTISGMHPEEWRQGFAMFNVGNSPWLNLVDPTRFKETVQRVARLQPTVIAGGHTPPILGHDVKTALDMSYDLPGMVEPELPGQADLEMMRAALIHE
jgi:hypothetical protein